MSLYDKLSTLPVRIDSYELELQESETSSDFTRVSTVVSLHGDDEVGRGEDVIYAEQDHRSLIENHDFGFAGEYTFDEFSKYIEEIDLFPGHEASRDGFENYRSWGFESAALDLALKQSDTNLGDVLGKEYKDVRFVVSTRLGDPPTMDRVERILEINPETELKLDPKPDWTPEVVGSLVETGSVRVLDLKGMYDDADVGQEPDPELYRMVVDEFPDAIIEDPKLTDETRRIFEDHENRVSWDYKIKSVESIENLRFEPNWINIKPSRFGSVESLLDTIEYCKENSIRMYGGGQFELGVGREHLHTLSSLFYPDSPNDVAPSGYNSPELKENLPVSPLSPSQEPEGLGF